MQANLATTIYVNSMKFLVSKNSHWKICFHLDWINCVLDELDSFMFQTVGHQGVQLISEAIGLPMYREPTFGKSKMQEKNYTPTDDDEVEDLYRLLKKVKVKATWKYDRFILRYYLCVSPDKKFHLITHVIYISGTTHCATYFLTLLYFLYFYISYTYTHILWNGGDVATSRITFLIHPIQPSLLFLPAPTFYSLQRCHIVSMRLFLYPLHRK